MTATYYVYQFDDYCLWDCDYWWDAFETSFLRAQGTVYQDNQYFATPGPPAARTPQSKTLYGQITRQGTNRPCRFPTGESSAFALWSSWYPYAGHFIGQLQDPDTYTSRVVGENLIPLLGDTCSYQNSPYPQMYATYNQGGWVVGTQQASDIGVFSTPYNSYGMDTVGFTNTSAYYHYRIRMQQQGTQCGLIYGQQMRIDSCGGQYSQLYGTQHGLTMTINSSGATVTRETTSATNS